MYRKQADRLIVRDVRRRLAADADWKQAVVASCTAHPEWFAYHVQDLLKGVGDLLQEAGIDLVSAEPKLRFHGNEGPAADE